MKKWNLILSGLLGTVFLLSGFLKVLDTRDFANAIASFGIVPDVGMVPVAVYLPWLEIFSGLSLFFRHWRKTGLLLILGQLIVFSLLLSWALYEGRASQCGCFGKWDWVFGKSLQGALVRDLVLIVISGWLLRFRIYS